MSKFKIMKLVPVQEGAGTPTPQMQALLDKRPDSIPTPQMQVLMDKRAENEFMEHSEADVAMPSTTSRPNIQWHTPSPAPPIPNPFPPVAPSPYQALPGERKKDGKLNVQRKLINTLQIVLKLASIQAYDNGGRILGGNGQFIPNSNIINLIMHSMAPGRILVGEEDFLNLMVKARVEPELLLNENVRSKLQNKYSNSISPGTTSSSDPSTEIRRATAEPYVDNARGYKRPFQEEEPEEPVRAKKRKVRWDFEDDD